MAADVGGRMEAVAPRRSLYRPDYLRLAVLAAVAVGVHLWLLSHTAVTARDSIGFARYALCLQSPHASTDPTDPTRTPLDIIRDAQHPPGYPAAICLVGKIVRATTDLPLPDAYLLAAQLVSAIAGVLLVIPTYLLGRTLYTRNVGFSAALLFEVLPVPARVTTDGLTEGLFVLLATTALLLGVRAVRRPGVGGFLLCGMATGVSYLVRPEGLMVAATIALVAGALGISRRWPRDLTAGRLVALGVGIALVAAPYMVLIGHVTNKVTPRQLLDPFGPKPIIWKGQPQAQAPVAGESPLFARWWNASHDGGTFRVWWAARATMDEAAKATFYLPGALALFGIVALRRRIAADPGLWVLLVLAVVNFGILIAWLAALKGYVSERHTVLLVLIGCIAAAAALEPLFALLVSIPKLGWLLAGRFVPAGLVLMIVGVALPNTLKPLHAQREGHKHAGRWIKDHLDDPWLAENNGRKAEELTPRACVIDPFSWGDWYAWRSLYYIPPDPDDATDRYTILDRKSRPEEHTRLPRMEQALAIAKVGTPVYHWPENVPLEDAEVVIYKTVGPSERDLRKQRDQGK